VKVRLLPYAVANNRIWLCHHAGLAFFLLAFSLLNPPLTHSENAIMSLFRCLTVFLQPILV